MEKAGQLILKTLAILAALAFLGGVMLTTVDNLFGGSKVRPLFGMSADALAGPTMDDGGLSPRRLKPPDAGTDAGHDAGEPAVERLLEPTFMPASKSFGGMGLPGVREKLGTLRGADAGTE